VGKLVMSEGRSRVSRSTSEVNSWTSVASELEMLLLSPSRRWRGDDIGIVCSGIRSGTNWAGGPVRAVISVHSALVGE